MTKPWLKLGCAAAALWIGAMPGAALAQAQPAPAPAPSPTPSPEPSEEAASADEAWPDDIVVTGELRGAVAGDIKPEIVLTPADVRAYGVSSISELITELGPQLRSGRGREGGMPVILLSGRRISNFAELRDLPPEAIERVDILPEEAALKFGYRADQRVVNIVLRPRFRSVAVELGGGMPTAGGFSNQRGELNVVRIGPKGRINLAVQYNGSSGLLESERDIVPTTAPLFDFAGNVTAPGGGEIDPALSAAAGRPVTIAGVPASAAGGAPSLADFAGTAGTRNASDVGAYRTLIAPGQQVTVNGVVSRNLTPKITASVNARIDISQRESLIGAPGVTLALPAANPFSPFGQDVLVSRYLDGLLPLSRSSQGQTAHVGFSVNGDALPWRWSVTGNYDRTTSKTVTDTGVDSVAMQARLDAGDPGFNPFAPVPLGLIGVNTADLANSTSSLGSIDVLINGPLAKLPAGDISTSLRVSGRTSDFRSTSLRGGVPRDAQSARDTGSAQLNIDLPIASRNRAVLSPIGNFSLNANVEVEQLSDFGTLITTGYGAVWGPLPQLRFILSFTDEEGAPSAQQLSDPAISTPNVRLFDYVRGETVDVTTIGGGNPFLGADSRHVMKIGANLTPIDNVPFNLSMDYVKSSTRNQISAFPGTTAEVEAAFPQRFERDADGRLLSVDTRAVNFGQADREELRWGFNLSLPVGSTIEKRVQQRRAEAGRTGTPLPAEGWRGRRGQQGQGQPAQPGQAQPAQPAEGQPAQAQSQPGQQAQAAGQPGQGRAPGGFFGGGRGPGGGPGGGGRGPGGPGGMFGPNGQLAGRIQLSFYHTINLRSQIVIGPGLPVLDLLNGSATGSRGGQPRHEIDAQAGFSKDGYGIRLIGRWQSGTTVNSGALGSGERLDFSGLGTLGIRAFIDLGVQQKLIREHRWLRGTRVTLSVDNLFDSRLRVTDSNGTVPLGYQPDLLDPQGRMIRLSVRKLFF